MVVLAIAVSLGVLVFDSPVEAGGRPLTAELSSANEVPPSGTGATGSAHLTLNQGQQEICFDIATSGLAGTVFAGHIHNAVAGVNGPVVVNLGLNSANQSGCVDADEALIKAIRQNPSDYYINVHTTAIPSGEVRGQLSK